MGTDLARARPGVDVENGEGEEERRMEQGRIEREEKWEKKRTGRRKDKRSERMG